MKVVLSHHAAQPFNSIRDCRVGMAERVHFPMYALCFLFSH